MSRKLFALLSVLLVTVLVLAACGGSKETPAPEEAAPAVEEAAPAEEEAAPAEEEAEPAAEEAEQAPAEEEAAAEEAAEAPEEVATEEEAPAEESASGEVINLTFIGAGPGAEAQFTKEQVDQWNAENPDIQVTVIDGPTSATDRFGLYLQTFEAQSSDIDAMMIDVIWPGDLAEHLVDLNEYGAADMTGDMFESIVTNNTVDGKLVGLPWFTDGGILYYRTDLLEKYGYDSPPATWDELEEMANTIQEGERAENQDFWGFVWQGKAFEGLTCDALEWIYSVGGGDIISPDKVITIDNPAAADMLDRAAGWIGTISPPGVTGFMEEESRAVFQGGNAAFMRNWPYAYNLGQADDSAVQGLFDVGPLPGGEAGQSAATLGGWQLAVSKYSQNPEAAAKFIMWIGDEEQQKERALGISLLPTYPHLYEDADIAEVVPFMPNLLDVFTNAVARPSTVSAPKYNETSTIFFSSVSDVLTGEMGGKDAVATIALDLEDLLGFEIGAP